MSDVQLMARYQADADLRDTFRDRHAEPVATFVGKVLGTKYAAMASRVTDGVFDRLHERRHQCDVGGLAVSGWLYSEMASAVLNAIKLERRLVG